MRLESRSEQSSLSQECHEDSQEAETDPLLLRHAGTAQCYHADHDMEQMWQVGCAGATEQS